MRARFIGDPAAPGQDPESITHLGIEWPLNKWVKNIPVTVGAKLAGHSHFEVQTEEEAKGKGKSKGDEPPADEPQD